MALRKLERRIHPGESQIISTFAGQVIQIPEFSTACKAIRRSIHLSNMKYAHITADVGAAEKYYELVWNNPDELTDVIIHLRVVHTFMYFFSNCGKFVINNGFEEIVYQARLCSVIGIKPVLSGNSDNMCWRIHEVVARAISRLFQEQYVAPLTSEKWLIRINRTAQS